MNLLLRFLVEDKTEMEKDKSRFISDLQSSTEFGKALGQVHTGVYFVHLDHSPPFIHSTCYEEEEHLFDNI